MKNNPSVLRSACIAKPNTWLRILFYGGALVFISYKVALAWYQGELYIVTISSVRTDGTEHML